METTVCKKMKVSKYRQALEEKKNNPATHWSDITRQFNVGTYPYINNFEKVSDSALDSISSVFNLIKNNEDVALAFKQVISKKFGLVDPDTLKEDNLINFQLASIEDRDLTEQIEIRKLYKSEDGRWHKKVMKQVEDDIEI